MIVMLSKILIPIKKIKSLIKKQEKRYTGETGWNNWPRPLWSHKLNSLMAWHICTCHPQWHWVWLNPMSIPARSVGKLYYKLISITREFLDTQSSISYCGLLHPVQLSNIYDDHTWPNKNRMAFCQSFFMIRETKIVYRYIWQYYEGFL